MTFTRAAVKNMIMEKLNKTPTTRGFYTDAKADQAIQESIDFVATMMMMEDEGFVHKIDYFDTTTGFVKQDIPPHISMIAQVRYLVGNTYLPLQYEQDFTNTQWSAQSGMTQFPSRYRVVDNAIYFNPALGVGGAQYLQIEYMTYPKFLRNDSDFVETYFDRAMIWYVVYKSCSILCANIQQMNVPWAMLEAGWLDKITNIIAKRNQQATPIGEFEGF